MSEYLLGSLPTEETERLDELSFTDDEFAEALQAVENDLVDAYIQGELAGPKLEKFKASYLSSPTGRQKVEFARSLQAFGEKNWTPEPIVEPVRTKTGWLSIFAVPRFAQFGFAAATIALLVVGGWLIFENIRLQRQINEEQANKSGRQQTEENARKELEQQQRNVATAEEELARLRKEQESKKGSPEPSPAPVSIASFILAPQMRSSGQVQTISLPPNTTAVSMRLQLDPNDFESFRVTLLDQANRTIWRSGNVKASGTGTNKAVRVTFSSSLLKQQVYTLQVAGAGTSEIVNGYSFKVAK